MIIDVPSLQRPFKRGLTWFLLCIQALVKAFCSSSGIQGDSAAGAVPRSGTESADDCRRGWRTCLSSQTRGVWSEANVRGRQCVEVSDVAMTADKRPMASHRSSRIEGLRLEEGGGLRHLRHLSGVPGGA